jgi:nucleotide-binding universal stress UspA family protein
MHDILAHANNYRTWSRSLEYAAEFSALIDASLTGIYVQEPILPMPAFTQPQLFTEIYSIAAEQVAAAQAVESAFKTWATGLGVKRSCWQVAEGPLPDVLAAAGNWHDLLVLGTGSEARWDAVGGIGELLLKTGLRGLVVSERARAKASLNSIAVAWNGSPESIRAIHAALPLLKRAKRVTLVHGERAEPYSLIGWKPPLDMDAYLTQHGIRFTRQPINISDDRAGEGLLIAAAGADILVMGAYGKARFSEWIFGGATRHVLEHSTIPLFMRH